jgi:photosystem II stability/assembly factor-like uncharacterized protein
VSGWQRLYARPGGTVTAFAVSADGLVYAATSAGVFTSTDAGRTWLSPFQGEIVPFNEAISISPDGSVYVGTRTGLYRSTDGLTTWGHVLAGARVLSLVAAGDLLLVGTEQDGVLRSDDRGRNFSGANAGLVDLGVLAMALSPEFGQDGTAFVATASGLYRTRNGAKSWRALDLDAAVQCLCISEHGVVLAGTESDGLLRSNDGGAHWESVSTVLAASVTAIAHSERSGHIAIATEHGIAISADAATSWRMTAVDIGSVLALEFVSDALLAGLHRDGVARAAEPFDNWIYANEGLQARLLLALTVTDQALFAAGPDDGVVVSRDAGQTWTTRLTGPEDPRVFAIVAQRTSVLVATDAGIL